MSFPSPDILVLGAGLAGCEAALTLARRGLRVRLYDRKPERRSEASHSGLFGELVCSNSLRARSPENAVGLLKEELSRLGSFVMAAACETEVPAGGAMAVDRDRFAAWLTEAIRRETRIETVCGELPGIPESSAPVIVATGPLTSDALAAHIAALTGQEQLHFYDAIAPIVSAESLDMSVIFRASRYGKGGDDYLNLPMNEEEYHRFVAELRAGAKVPPRAFEDPKYFEGCLPVEILAERGDLVLAYGPMKPVGLIDPRTGARPFAVVQLRAENLEGSAYNLVGFQTRLTHPEQLRIFRSLPGLGQAEFLRLGSVHRNTFLDAPKLLDDALRLKTRPTLRFAGQLAGVEGYVESTACGLYAALSALAEWKGLPLLPPPRETALGALMGHLREAREPFEPSNVTHAMFPPLNLRLRKRDRKSAYAERARSALAAWMSESGLY